MHHPRANPDCCNQVDGKDNALNKLDLRGQSTLKISKCCISANFKHGFAAQSIFPEALLPRSYNLMQVATLVTCVWQVASHTNCSCFCLAACNSERLVADD